MVDIPRICANCSCEQTPLWRRSPLGPKTLCNACGVRMKKGRLVFVPQTRSFITVESPAAVAKRQRKEREARELKQHLAGARVRHGLNNTALPGRNSGPAAAGRQGSHAGLAGGQGTAAGGLHHVASQQQTTSRPVGVAKSGTKRPRKAFKVPQGLYYLLAAIEVVETA